MINRLAELRRKKENGEGGFTLIELLVVVVIIGILMAIAVPLYLNYRKGANDKAAQSDLRAAVTSLEQCMSDNSSYPTAVNATTGAYTGCAGQTGTNPSANTTLTYNPGTTTSPTAYTIYAKNTGGDKTYCYTSSLGGQVKASAAATSTYAASCPNP